MMIPIGIPPPHRPRFPLPSWRLKNNPFSSWQGGSPTQIMPVTFCV